MNGNDDEIFTEHPTRRLLRASLVFGGLLLANEVLCALIVFRARLGQAKVKGTLREQPGLMSGVVTELAWMLAVVAATSLLVGWAWGSISLAGFDSLRRRFAPTRAMVWLYWSVAGFAFFNVWYSVHHMILPGSRLKQSLLFRATGALTEPLPMTVPRYAPFGVSAVVVGALTVLALKRSRRLRWTAAGAVALLATVIGVYSRATDVGTPRPFVRDDNVVLLGLDSFQMNRLSLGGHPKNLAPTIDEFLTNSYRFDSGWTPFARTYPSWMSILTGRFPPGHGVRFNLMPDEAIAFDNAYLGERFREAGYATLHATDETRFSVIREQFGFDDLLHARFGIDDFVVGTFFDFSTTNLMRQTFVGHDLFPAIANNRASASYNADIWVRNLQHKIDALPRDKPVFLVAHLCGDHWPFSSHAPYSFVSDDSVEQCIAMVDDQARQILDFMEAVGLRERSTIVMLSDHGDGWSGKLDDPANTHGDDFNHLGANMAIVGVQGPSIRPGVNHESIRTVDLYPTVLDLVGIEYEPQAIDGISLLPALRGEPIESRPVFAETGMVRNAYTVKKLMEQNAHFYAFNAQTGLMHMRPDACAEFMDEKSFMLIDGDLRMVIKPAVKLFRLHAFDPETGRDAPGVAVADDERRAEMLMQLAAVYRLDGPALIRTARERGFLGNDVAMR